MSGITKKKCERGILGVIKDPSRPMLFSFKARKGEEFPSDDSGDSDYQPSDNESEECYHPTIQHK